MAVGTTRFNGIKPGTSARNIRSADATVAHNVRLLDGSLQAELAPGLVREEAYTIKSIYVPTSGECCPEPMTFPHCTSVTEPADPGACCGIDHVVVWDSCDGYYRKERCGDGVYPLVVEAPTKTLTVTKTASGTTVQADARSYTYTWVDRFGTESQPAPPSLPIQARDGDVYVLGNFGVPPANATLVRIYRTSSEFEGFKNNGATQAMGTTFQLVDELTLPMAGSTYTDLRRLKDIEFGTLTTHEQCPPPACMTQVVLTNQGYHVGFLGNDLFVSERNEPGNWPTKYQQTLPDKIVGIVTVHDVVLVATTGQPYRVTPRFRLDRDEADAEIDVSPIEGHYPCLQRETMVATDFGAVYAAEVGLVSLHATTSTATVSTQDLIGPQAWLGMVPNIAAWHQGAYYGVRAPSANGFRLEFPRAKDRAPDLTTMDIDAHVIHAGRDGHLYFAKGRELYRWGAGPSKLTYRWRSKEFQFWGTHALGAAQVLGDFGKPLEFRLLSAGTVVYSRAVNSNASFRLPTRCARTTWQIELVGTTRVHAVMAGPTIRELSDVERSSRSDP